MKCPYCGNEINQNNKFCKICGAKVRNNDNENNNTDSAPTVNTPTSKKKSRKKLSLIIIPTVLVLIAALGLFTWIGQKNEAEKHSKKITAHTWIRRGDNTVDIYKFNSDGTGTEISAIGMRDMKTGELSYYWKKHSFKWAMFGSKLYFDDDIPKSSIEYLIGDNKKAKSFKEYLQGYKKLSESEYNKYNSYCDQPTPITESMY